MRKEFNTADKILTRFLSFFYYIFASIILVVEYLVELIPVALIYLFSGHQCNPVPFMKKIDSFAQKSPYIE